MHNGSAALVLIGAPGSGKTSVGRLVAARLQLPWIDTDEEVERLAGSPVGDIFTTRGEAVFRQMEATVCLDAFAQDAVVSVGGGAPMTEAVRTALATLPTVWLQATIADIAERVRLDVPRPLLMGDTRKLLTQLMADRTPVYEAAASFAVSTSGKTPDEIADEIIAKMPVRGTVATEEH